MSGSSHDPKQNFTFNRIRCLGFKNYSRRIICDRTLKSTLVGLSSSIILIILCLNLRIFLISEAKQLSRSHEAIPQRSHQSNKCNLTRYVRLVQIHGCIKFNLSLNGCHGRCNSFAIANTDDVKRTLGLGDSSKFGRDHWSIESKSIQSAIQMNDLSAKGQVSINRRQFYQSDNHENKQDPPSNSFKSENRMNHTNFRNSNQDKFNSHSSERRGRNIAKKSHSRFRNILKPLESHEASYQDGEIEYNRLIGKTSGLHSEAKDIVSISRCCAMKGKPKFITIKLMCTDGWRSLVFAEAQDCHCSSCSAVD